MFAGILFINWKVTIDQSVPEVSVIHFSNTFKKMSLDNVNNINQFSLLKGMKII